MRRIAAHLLVAMLSLAAWQVLGTVWPSARFTIGRPTEIATELWSLCKSGQLFRDFGVTAGEAAAGLVIGTVAGSAVGLAMWYSNRVAILARPYVVAVGAVPVFAFAPLMIVWFGIGFSMKMALAAFSTFFVALAQAYRGATLVGPELSDTLVAMRATRRQLFIKVIVPGSLDWVLASARMNVGFGLLGAFIGEFIAADRGLGHLMLKAAGLYNIPRAFAAAVGIVVLALAFDAIAGLIEGQRHSIIQTLSVPRVVWKKWSLRRTRTIGVSGAPPLSR